MDRSAYRTASSPILLASYGSEYATNQQYPRAEIGVALLDFTRSVWINNRLHHAGTIERNGLYLFCILLFIAIRALVFNLFAISKVKQSKMHSQLIDNAVCFIPSRRFVSVRNAKVYTVYICSCSLNITLPLSILVIILAVFYIFLAFTSVMHAG